MAIQATEDRSVFIRIPLADYECLRALAQEHERSINFVARRLLTRTLGDKKNAGEMLRS